MAQSKHKYGPRTENACAVFCRSLARTIAITITIFKTISKPLAASVLGVVMLQLFVGCKPERTFADSHPLPFLFTALHHVFQTEVPWDGLTLQPCILSPAYSLSPH